jgi:methionyl-tRNA synthetase
MITAALPYANGPLHIGHLAGAYLNSDIYARYQRLRGQDVLFACGSDEHGAAITLRAKKEGITPQEIVDKYHVIIKSAFEKLGISFDIYHRTSSGLHTETSQDFFLRLNDNGVFDVRETEQYYDEEFGQFLADRYITGTCPVCGHDGAYGDQCENCGSSLSPTELIDPVSTLSGDQPVLRKTKHWYMPLDQYEDWLREWIVEGKKGEWKPNVYGQCKSWIDGGLNARAMTRDLDWGVPVPLDDAEGKVLYVWLDAPIGYISASRQWAIDNGMDWKPYWMDEKTKLVHFIGKDNIVFHCVIFPALLKAHGDFILPENVPANEFMNLQGGKISTSRNWAVWAHEYLEDYPDKVDELRYTLIANMPETRDSEFTWEDYQARVNNELVATLGNLENRVVVLMDKYFNGRVPEVAPNELDFDDRQLMNAIDLQRREISEAIENYRFREALQALMELARKGNKYLGDNEPWKQIKDDEDAAARTLYVAGQAVASFALLAQPFLPFTAGKIRSKMRLEDRGWDFTGEWLPGGTNISKGELLFRKIDDDFVEAQIAKLEASKTGGGADPSKYQPMKDNITFDEFMKLDIRTGRITAAEKVEKTDKLLRLTVDLGFERRTIVSGIAEYFQPGEIIGREVAVVANLAPKKIRGVESQGMVLMAEDAEGKLDFVASTSMEPGMVIR